MSQVVNTNMSSLNGQRYLSMNQHSLTSAMQRLSSGLRINSAADDAAGFAISERFTTQIRGSDQAARNANDGISLAQTAEGDLSQISTNLQRIRELAVQAANSSNSASDRASIQNESNQLIAEIDRVAQNSSFNGTSLLNGTFSNKSFQIGANSTANDQITITSIASARSSSLGVGSSSSYSTVQSGTAVSAGVLAAGDLTINGKNVGATVADGVSYIGSASSGIAKAAAINAVSGDTGVTATVAATTVAGTAITAGAHVAIAAGNILINGVDIGAIGASTTEVERGAQVSAAINAKAGQTGVTATFDTTSGAVALTAADGRNITIGNDGKATSTAVIGAAAETGLGSSTTDGGAAGTSAEALAKAGTTTHSVVTLNSSGSAGITLGSGGALATAYVPSTVNAIGAIAAGDIMINGVAIGAVAGGSADVAAQAAAVALAIDDMKTVTGVSAVAALGVITLTSTSGGVGVTIKGSANEGLTGFKSGTTNVGDVGATATSLTAGYKAATATAGAGLSSLDFSTSAGAQSALTTIDSAINTINTSRAALGAYQNRFTSTIASLQTTSENLTASRSRIQDADFAKESANLSRAQVLQQAGTAMLAQANQSAQGVLTLLR
jgi:flagellin